MPPAPQFKSEKRFQDAVVQLSQLNGCLVYHTYDSRRSTPGFPDLVILRDDLLIFAELKTDKGKLSKYQSNWLDALKRWKQNQSQRLPFQVHLWRPSDWDAIIEILRRP